ncbi:hypothetical protein ACQPZX_28110 [Actinoplanes sp. CA-142083]|uniref:hypothetical protein n=1 Tax=Actinoplanes sp. CA-142083 TaxID=3239903 RepID=UPI003D93AA42
MTAPVRTTAPARPTVPLVRQEIGQILKSSPTFRSLPEDRRRQLAHDLVNIGQYMADAGGNTYGLPLAAAIGERPPARALADGDPAPPANPYTVDNLGAAIATVDFPGFVASLIKGVFQAIVDASIQQMEAFAELVKNVSKSVDEYMKDNVTPNQARDYLAGRYPDHLQVDVSGRQPKVVPKPDADQTEMPDFFKDLGLSMPVDNLDEQTTEEVLMPAARQQLAIDRQRMLLMMVMMGINRLVVTNGSVKAAVIFDLDLSSTKGTSGDSATTFDNTTNTRSKNSFFAGWFSPSWKTESENKINVTTSNKYDTKDTQELKAKLTGDVSVQFASETFPLDQMSNLLGLQEPSLPTSAPRTTPSP